MHSLFLKWQPVSLWSLCELQKPCGPQGFPGGAGTGQWVVPAGAPIPVIHQVLGRGAAGKGHECLCVSLDKEGQSHDPALSPIPPCLEEDQSG